MMSLMKFRHELTYAASPAEVFAMLGDRAFREKVYAAQEVVSAEVTITPHGAGFDLVSDQVQNTAGLPAIAKKITGDTTQAVIRESWADSSGARLEITSPGKPTSAAGTITLTETSTGTAEVVELEITVRVPLIGKKLEGLMAHEITSAIEIEQTVGAAWLAGEH